MKVYKVSMESFHKRRPPEFIFKDFDKAKDFACDNLKDIMKSVTTMSKKTKELEGREYIFKTYSDKDIEKLSVSHNNYYKSAKKIDEYIIEIAECSSEKIYYTYQIKNNIIKGEEASVDNSEYTYSIDIREFEIIE